MRGFKSIIDEKELLLKKWGLNNEDKKSKRIGSVKKKVRKKGK